MTMMLDERRQHSEQMDKVDRSRHRLLNKQHKKRGPCWYRKHAVDLAALRILAQSLAMTSFRPASAY